MEQEHTLVLARCAQPYSHQLQLVDLVCKLLDKVVIDGYALRLALRLVVVCDEDVGEFMPQLALPEIFEAEEVMLQIVRSIVTGLLEEVGDLLVVGCHGGLLHSPQRVADDMG